MLQSFSSQISDDGTNTGGPSSRVLNDEENEEFETLVQLYLNDAHYTSVSQAALNMTYSMINVGLVGLPFVAYQAGLPLFISVVIGFALISIYTTCIMIEMAEDKNVRSLEDLGEKAFGPRGYFTTCILQILFSLLLICITMDIWGDIVPELMKRLLDNSMNDGSFIYVALTNRRSVIILGGLLMLPGCFSRSLSRLSWPSFMTVCAITVAVVFVLISFFHHSDCLWCDSYRSVIRPRPLWWSVQGVVCFCFTFQRKLFFVYSSLRRRSPSRFLPAVLWSHSFVCVMYLFFGCLGALNATTSNDDDSSPISYNYFSDFESALGSRLLFDITRAIVAVSLLCTIPMDCMVAVTKWRRLLRRYDRYIKSIEWGEQDFLGTPSTSPFRPPRDWVRGTRGATDAANEEEQRESLLQSEATLGNVRGVLDDRFESDGETGGMCVEMMRMGGCLVRKKRTSDLAASSHRNGHTQATRHDELLGSAWDHKTNVQTSHASIASTVASSFASSSHHSTSLFRPPSCAHSGDSPSMGNGGSGVSPPRGSGCSGVVVDGSAHMHLSPHEEESCGNSAASSDALAAQSASMVSSSPYMAHGGDTTKGEGSKAGSESNVSHVSFQDDAKFGQAARDSFVHDEHDCEDVHPVSYLNDRDSGYSSALTVPWTKSGMPRRSVGNVYRETFGRDTEEDLIYGQEWLRQQEQQQQHSEMDDGRGRESILTEDAWHAAGERQSSVGHMATAPFSTKQQIQHIIHVICVWSFTLGVSLINGNWIVWVAALGCIVTSAFTFLLPSMIYFRLGVKSDFMSIPILGYVLPNRLCMFLIQYLGILCILGNFTAGIHFFIIHEMRWQ